MGAGRRGGGREESPFDGHGQQARAEFRRGIALRHPLREVGQNSFRGRELRPTARTGAEMLRHHLDGFRLQGVQQIVRQQLFTVVTREWSSHG